MNLVWIVVNDLKKAIEFYTETVGLKLMEQNDQFGWAELEGHNGGARLGIAQMCLKSEDDVKPGQNSYSIIIGAGILAQTGEKLKTLGLKDKAVIITNPTVHFFSLGGLASALQAWEVPVRGRE